MLPQSSCGESLSMCYAPNFCIPTVQARGSFHSKWDGTGRRKSKRSLRVKPVDLAREAGVDTDWLAGAAPASRGQCLSRKGS